MIDTGQKSDVGIQREVNQDSAGVMELENSLLLVVADGMGGHAAGEMAARIVVESMFDKFEAGLGGDPRENLYFGAQESHRRVLRYGEEHNTYGMGSTLVAAYIVGTKVYVAHIGDSRFYLFRDGEVFYRTTDHTKVQQLLELGALTAEQARNHPEGNIITRAVGHERADGVLRPFEADVISEPLDLEAGDTLLLCSDGLYDLVSDREMIEIVSGAGAQPACDQLVNLANERGGHDNITVVLLHAAGGTPPPPAEKPGPTSSAADTLEDPIAVPAPVGGRGEAPTGPLRGMYLGPEPDEPASPPKPSMNPKALAGVLGLLVVAAVVYALTSLGGDAGGGAVAPPAAAGDAESAAAEAPSEPNPEPTEAPAPGSVASDDDDSAGAPSASDDDDSAGK